MPCYSPLTGFYSKNLNNNGKRNIVFKPSEALDDRSLNVPCGRCIGCRLERSRQWAMRCVHEASLYKENSFLTLTYNPENLPEGGTLVKKHYQDFMKRLRFYYPNKQIRYFHCGEYGDKLTRPHYHAILYNHDFHDKTHYKTINKQPLYISPTLTKIWGHGHATTGSVTFESAAYVARYCTKKISGEAAFFHYNDIDTDGEIHAERIPEYTTMSRRPGIGRPWLDKYLTDVYPSDFVLINGKKIKPPKYYDNIHDISNPFVHDEIKERREKSGKKNSKNNTPTRLSIRETLQNYKLNLLKRTYDNET